MTTTTTSIAVRYARPGEGARAAEHTATAAESTNPMPAETRWHMSRLINRHGGHFPLSGSHGPALRHFWAADDGDAEFAAGCMITPGLSLFGPARRTRSDWAAWARRIWEVGVLATDPAHRGRGLGTALLDHAAAHLSDRVPEASAAFAAFDPRRPELARWYRRRGWIISPPGYELVFSVPGGVPPVIAGTEVFRAAVRATSPATRIKIDHYDKILHIMIADRP